MRSSEAAMGTGGAQRPVWGGNELKKTGARSARARTRGQNPLVFIDLHFKLGSPGYAGLRGCRERLDSG
jgi:hypothetical protein